MAGIKFDITGDNRNVLQSFNEVQSGVKQMQRQVEDSGASIEDMFKRIGAVAGLTFAGVSAKEFVRNVMNVRGEFQKLEVAFTTMLQSEEKAASLMNQLVKTAAITPFDLKGVADGAKQLLAYGIAADEVNDTLVHLGDIAAGLSIPLGDLVYLYGTTMVQGRMFTQDLRQFQGRGIPIAEELAKQFGVAKDKVGELVTAGKVGAEQVKKALMDMSSEGGKFGGLMEEQAKTINGQISNIEDAIDVMFNNIGKQNEGIINTALSGVSTLVENYEAVGKAIVSAVAVYGVYKAAIMTVTAMQALQTAGVGALTAAETAHYGWIVLVEKAQKLLNATMLSNPYVLVATAIAGVVAVMMNMKSQQDLINDAEEEYNRKKEEAIAKEEEHKRKIEELLSVAGDEKLSTDSRRLALVQLEQQYHSIFDKYNTEAEKLKHILDIKKEIAELDGKNSVKNKGNELNSVNSDIKNLQNAINSRRTGNSGKYADNFVGTSTQVLQARLTNLLRKRGELQNSISKNNTDAYLANLTGISNDDLQKQINERRNLLAKMQTTEKKYGRVTSGGAKGTYSADELQGQLQILEAEQNKRNEAKYTPAQQKAIAKKALDDANKALADFDKSTTKYTTAEAEEARKKLTDAVSEAEKEYKKFGGKTGGKKTEPAKTLKQEQRYTDLEAELERKASRDAIYLEHSTRQAEIDAMEEGSKKTIAQIRLDYDRRKEEIDRGYEDLRIRKIEDAKKLWEANPANKDKVFDETTVDTSYTDAERKNYEALLKANETELARSLKAQADMEMQSMLDYLKEYGSFEEKRLAITEEYAEKIRKAEGDPYKQTMFERQRDEQIQNARFESQKDEMDWEGIFNNLARYSVNFLDKLRGQLQNLLNDPNITPENAMIVSEKISDIDRIREQKTENTFNWNNSFLEEQKRLQQEAAVATQIYNDAMGELLAAETDASTKAFQLGNDLSELGLDMNKLDGMEINLDKVKAGDVDKVIDNLGIDKNSDEAKKLKKQFDDLAKSQAEVTEKTKDATKAQKKKEEADDKSDIPVKDKIAKFMQGLNEDAQKYLGDVPALFEKMGFGEIGEKVQAGLDGLNSATDAAAKFASGDYVGAALSAFNAVESFGTMLGIFGESDASLNEDMKKLTASNERLQKSIDRLSDKMDEQTFEAIGDTYEMQLKSLANMINGTQDILVRTLIAHKSGLFSSDDSAAKAIADALSPEDLETIREFLKQYGGSRLAEIMSKYDVGWEGGAPFGTMLIAALGGMTPEALAKFREQYQGIWLNILKIGQEEGYKDPSDLFEQLADLANKADELQFNFFEKISRISFDDLESSFKEALMSMEEDAGDTAEDISKIMAQALIGDMYNSTYLKKLKEWYGNVAQAMQTEDKSVRNAQLQDLKAEYQQMMDEARQEAQLIKDMTGYTEAFRQNNASTKGFQAMGQDLGAELNGRFTAVQIAGENISDQMLVVVSTLNSIASFNQSSNTAVIEIRDMLIFTNSYLEDMVKYAKLLYSDFGEKLDEIVSNTGKM